MMNNFRGVNLSYTIQLVIVMVAKQLRKSRHTLGVLSVCCISSSYVSTCVWSTRTITQEKHHVDLNATGGGGGVDTKEIRTKKFEIIALFS